MRLDSRREYIKNHYTPKFYLNGFSKDEGVIWVKGVKKYSHLEPFQQNVSNIGYEEYLNTEGYEKFTNLTYDSKFRELQHKVRCLCDMYESGLYVPKYYIDDMFNFIAYIFSHNKHVRELLWNQIWNKVGNENNISINGDFLDIRCKDYIPQVLYKLFRSEISKWAMYIDTFDNGEFQLITSDNPVSIVDIPSISIEKSANLKDVFKVVMYTREHCKILHYLSSLNTDKDGIYSMEELILEPDFNDNTVIFFPFSSNVFITLFRDINKARLFRKYNDQARQVLYALCCGFTYSNAKEFVYCRNKSSLNPILNMS